MIDFDPLLNLDVTYEWSKFSCSKTMYFIHVICSYLVMISGLACMITRCFLKLKWMHVGLGRSYVLFMLWNTGTSLVIHNSGLPLAVLISFIWVLGGLTFGWMVITIHQSNMWKKAHENVLQKILSNQHNPDQTLHTMVINEKANIAAKKTFKERMISWKALHGALMFTSWLNIAGRIGASNQTGDFQCHTYPVYKPVMSNKHYNFTQEQVENKVLILVNVEDPNYNRLPWANKEGMWGALLLFGPFFAALFFGAIFAFMAVKKVENVSPHDKKQDKAGRP